MNLLSNAFSVASKEWKWIAASPTTDVARPKAKPHRDRRISQDEIERICVALDWRHDAQDMILTSTKQRVALVFLFAIETAIRSGEICALRKEDVNGAGARLHMTKNGFQRDVALSPRALERWKMAPDGVGVTTASLDAMPAQARRRWQSTAALTIAIVHAHRSTHQSSAAIVPTSFSSKTSS